MFMAPIPPKEIQMRKNHLAVLAVVLSLGLTLAMDAEAKRLGGVRSSGPVWAVRRC